MNSRHALRTAAAILSVPYIFPNFTVYIRLRAKELYMLHSLKQIGLLGLIGLLLLALLSGCAHAPEAAESAVQKETAAVPERQPKEGIQTILVVSLNTADTPQDSEAYRNGNQADLILALVIDEGRGEATALQLNPDTVVSFTPPGSSEPTQMTLGLVYSYGSGGSDSCLSGSKAVSRLLGGARIDHYMTFTTDSIGIVSDMIGGVPVGAETAESAEAEYVTLLGEDAVEFFRFRNAEDTANEEHMARQRQYMAGMYAPILESAQQEDFLTRLTLQLGDRFSTDLTLSQMVQMMQSLETCPLEETVLTIPGTADCADGQPRFYPDAEYLAQTVDQLFFQEAM